MQQDKITARIKRRFVIGYLLALALVAALGLNHSIPADDAQQTAPAAVTETAETARA